MIRRMPLFIGTVVALRVFGVIPMQLPAVLADSHPPSHVLPDAVFRMKQRSSSTIWRGWESACAHVQKPSVHDDAKVSLAGLASHKQAASVDENCN